MHDLILVGGGVIGLSIAWEASGRGLRVLVLEAGKTGRASSWAGAGMLPTPQRIGVEEPLELLRLRSHQLHASWAERLREVTGIDTQYRRCGAVAIGRTVGEFATLAANEAWWGRHGMEYQRLGPEELQIISNGSWIEVEDASGKPLFAGILEGERRFPIGPGLRLNAGRPDLVRYRIGKRPAAPLGAIEDVGWRTLASPLTNPDVVPIMETGLLQP